MASQTIWIVDTQNRSSALAEAIASPEIGVVSFSSTNQLAQTLAGGAIGAVIANISENEDFETLEHLSKISLTFPEIPMVLLLPEPMHAAMDWGPRVFNLIKPVSPESLLRRLSYLDEHSYPTRGILQKGYLLALLDYCLLQKKHARISIRYVQKHEIVILIQQGRLHSLYIDNQHKNDKILFPFALDGAEFSLDYIEHDAHTVFDEKFAISDDDYRRFRLELHPFLSLTQQFPPMSEVLQIDDARLMQVLNSLPEQVHSVIRYFDGVNDLFRIFTTIDLRPLETAQRIGYLYFSDVFRKNPDWGEGAPVRPAAPGKEPPKPERESASSELAAWLWDPVSAARQLESRIRESLKSRRDARGQFRPHRKTQPGLGGLLRPVGAEAAAEEETSGAGWGGASTQMLRESREFFRPAAPNEPVPGLAPQEIVMEVDDEPDAASGVIDVSEPEKPPADDTKAGKIILEGSHGVSGEAVVDAAPEPPPVPSFHDEPTVPLEPQDEEDFAKESLNELLSLRAGAEKPAEKDERFRETKQLQAFLIPEEAMPETGGEAAVLALVSNEPALDAETTPSPGFEDVPNGAVTPRPEVAINEPTPVPQVPESASLEESASAGEFAPAKEAAPAEESAFQAESEASLQAAGEPDVAQILGSIESKTEAVQLGDASGGILVFQKEMSHGSRWKAFAAVLALAVLIVAGYALWGGGSNDMTAETSSPLDAASNRATETVVMREMPSGEPSQPAPMPAPVPPMDASVPVMEPEMTVPGPDAPPETPVVSTMEPEMAPPAADIARLREKAAGLYENYRRRGVKASLKELEKLAQENPDFADAAAYLGDIHYNDGRIAKAYAWARKAVDRDRNQPLAWWVVGLVAYEAGRKAEYVEAFREYIRLSPEDENAKKIRQLKIRELSNP